MLAIFMITLLDKLRSIKVHHALQTAISIQAGHYKWQTTKHTSSHTREVKCRVKCIKPVATNRFSLKLMDGIATKFSAIFSSFSLENHSLQHSGM